MKKVKTNKLGRRILSFVLTVALMVGLMPGNMLTVSAEGAQAGKSEEIVVETVSSNDATSTTECTCETDDPAFHATNCPAYIAPENPQCTCAEKCTEDTLNIWCDVCGVQGVSACQGTDTAVTYDAATPDFSTAKVLTAVDGALCVDGVALEINTDKFGDTYVIIPEGNYKLTGNIATDIYIRTEGSINLDLNGYTWDMSGKYLILNNNVTLSLYDTSVNKTGKITSSFDHTIRLSGSGSTFNLYSGTVENTSDNVNAKGVSCYYGSSNLYGGTIKSNAYAVFYYLDQNITINIDNTSFDCGDGYAQIFTSLSQHEEPCAVIDVSDYTGGVLTVDAKINKAGKIKIFTGIQSAQDAENYKINFSCDDNNDFLEEKQEYEEDGGNKYVYVSVPSFTTQPTEENGYTVAFNHPDATLQWCEVTVYDSATYSEEDGYHGKLYRVNAGDALIVSVSECSDDFYVKFYCSYNEETLSMRLYPSRKTASVTFDSEGIVNVHCEISPRGTGEYKIEHVRYTELEGETDVQLSKTECETTYRCKATLGETVYYSDEVTIEQEHSYTCTATSDNVITKECANCGKVGGTLTIEAEGGVYDGTTAYGATVIKTGILENEEVTVNYYQGDTLIGTDAPVDAGTYTAKITYEEKTASVTYTIKTTPTADMFIYTSSAEYDGTEKSANVVVKDGITGMGEITNTKYYQNGTEVTPINAGTYTVKIDVAEGDDYAAATDIEVGTFEITKANTVITWNDQTLASTGEEAELTAPTLTFIGNDNPEVVLAYSYKVQGDAEYTAGLPSDCGIYDVKVNVSETDNYNAVEDTMTLTITCTDADNNGICDHCGSCDEPELVDEYYQIANAGNLMWFAQQVNEGQTTINAKLTADIDMKDIDWTMMSSFAGTFDGNGYTISGLNGHKTYTENTHGFIRTLADGGVVKNLTFTEADIWNHEGSGAISAVIVYTNYGTVENCVVKSSLIQHGNYDALGVVVGVNDGTIRNCASISNTVKRRYSGEGNKAASVFVWSNGSDAIIENCIVYDCTYEKASVNYAFTGINNGTITNCYYYESSETISDTVATAKTAKAFASGEVAYLLNGEKTDGTQSWYQTLGTDTHPVLDSEHGKVYYGYANCQTQDKIYANTELSKDKPEHSWKCEPDEANTNKMTFSCTTDGCTKGGTITVTAPEGAIYDGNNHTATVTVETEENEELIATPVITYDSLTEGVELVDGKPVNAGTYQAKVSFEGVLSYQEFEIKKAILDVTGATATGRTYEKGNASVVITEVALEGVANLDAVSVDVTGLKGTLSGANAGDYTEVTLPELKLSGADKDNYVLTQPSKAVPTNVTISPQATGTAQNVTKKYLFSQENADTIHLVSLLPKDCGTVVSYGKPAVDGNVTYKVAPSIEEGTLAYTVADGSEEIVGNKGTITIDAKTQNYTSVPITISVALVDQIPVNPQTEVTLKEESQKLTYGQKLSALALTEVVFKGTDGETVTGTLQWKNGDSIPTVDTKKASWEFVPSASYNDKYATAEGELTISVVPATPVVDTLPTVNAITYHPDTTLADIALSGGKMNGIAGELTGTWAWKDATICPKAGDKTYVAVFTPEDDTHYKTKEVDITVSVAKATPYIKIAVAAKAVTYGATLKDSALSGGTVQYSETDETAVAGSWSWKEVTTKPVVADSKVTQYDVVFTPTDAENYNKVETKITLTVNKAETAPNMPESTMNVSYSKKTICDVELPEGWVWNEADSAKELAVDVAVEATAIYNGADKGNYVTESVTISITRQACDHEESDILYTGEGEKAPTCTVDGIGHTECTKCKESMQTNVTVEASGHTGGTATCKNKAECSTCHEGYGELDKNNHAGETEVKDAKKATCAVDGYTGDTYCKDCGAKIATGTKIDKSTAHTWDNGVVTKEATATEKGEKTYTCSVCKTTKKEEIPALGAPKVGEEIASEDGSATYKVTEAGENGNSVTYEAPTDKNQATVVVPATVTINNITYNVTTISDTAFAGNKKLTSVTIGDNVTGFSDKTFKGCSNLKTLIIGNGVTSIPANAFKNFKKLTTVKMGTGVKTIGKNAFYGCKKLKNLTIGKNVVTIGDKAFYQCTSLTKVTIPSKVKTIGKSTFEGCKALKTITIGKSVTKIGSKAFYGCSKTKTLTIKSSKLTTKKIGSKAFTKTPKSMTVKVPKKKFKAYKSMFIKRGVNKKARFKKS